MSKKRRYDVIPVAIPSDDEFEQTMADYLTFEFKMIAKGRGYLFGYEED
jgi:hypothetical protein